MGMEANGVALGLTAALCWGVADFCARGASRAGGTFATLVIIQPLGILGLLLVGLPLGQLRLSHLPLDLVLLAAGVNLLIMSGAGFLYRAFAVGKLALVSPIAAGFAAITALLSLLSGDRPSPLALAGIALTLIGVVVASAVPGDENGTLVDAPGLVVIATQVGSKRWRPPPGLAEALAATLIFGVGYWLLHFLTPQLGGVTVAFIGKTADFVVLGSVALILAARHALAAKVVSGPVVPPQQRQLAAAGHKVAAPTRDHLRDEEVVQHSGNRRLALTFWLFVIPTGLLDTLANAAYNVGVSVALTSVVVVLSSLFSAVTVLLAWIFLRERLAAWQWAGVLAILAGVALVNL